MNIVKTTLAVIFTLAVFFFSEAKAMNYELYSQTTYLHKFSDPITQNKFVISDERLGHEIYGGFYLDFDSKTNSEEGYTDAQIAPLVGVQSKIFGNEWLYSRYFLEGRFVHRLKAFPDDRARSTYDLRAGLLGYGLKELGSRFFLENYYAAFYTRLYGEKVILQGWTRQGLKIVSNLEVFNEFFGDTFDQTRDREGTFDLRPGARLVWRFQGGSVQLIHQWLYHMSNVDVSGRNEERSSLILGFYW